ncbi:MAG: outer membrane beta-barrel protein [Desulfuromonadaceae bacterium]|nr:outer membrane beta-barrel protein [Desulfuromonas sp.]MDY0185642.1 outer membrane beta-barrel protein [Desulfuromonadaceae bacterium]
MKIRILLAGLLLLASTSAALASGPYIGLAGGITIAHDADSEETAFYDGVAYKMNSTVEYDAGFGVNASVGYDFQPVRVEFEFGYKKNDVDKLDVPFSYSESGDIQVTSYMLNVLYDFNTYSRFTPYAGAGIGLLRGKLKGSAYVFDYGKIGYTGSDTELGYQVIIGAAFHIDTHFALDLSYRFLHAPSDFSASGMDIEYSSSNLMVGLRLKF